MSGSTTRKQDFARVRHRSEREIKKGHPVLKLLGLEPLRDPFPDDLTPLERIKVFAREGFLHFYGSDEAEFEQIWAEAFPEEKKGGRK